MLRFPDRPAVRARTSAALLALAGYPALRAQLPAIRREASEYRRAGVDRSWLRGVNFYSPAQLPVVLAHVFGQFEAAHARYPNLVAPSGFNERVVRSNFFRLMKIPESGNKLLTASFIPDHLRADISCPQILWSGTRLDRTALDALTTGESYYLKAAHGSAMGRRFHWPLTDGGRAELTVLGARWMHVKYNLMFGQWWYSAFPPMLLIERDVGGNGFSVNCFCFNGIVGLVALHSQATGETITLSDRFQFIGQKKGHSDWRGLFDTETLEAITELAGELSRDIEFARFDFLVGDRGEIFLGEVTFSPGNGNSQRPDGVDEHLGRLWSDSAGS